MLSDKKDIFEETISQRLASVLNIEFPLQDSGINLTEEQYEILKRTDKAGNTQLMIAAEQGELDSVEFLIRHGADVNYRNKKTRQRAIDLAWDQGNYRCMLALLEADSDFPETFYLATLLNDIETPVELKSFVKETEQLHDWIREGNVEKVQNALSKRENLRNINCSGHSAIETAIYHGDVNVLASLLGLPYPIHSEKISLTETIARLLTITNALGYTPLLLAAREGNKDAVDLLLRCGAEVNFLSTSGKTAADLAWENHHCIVVSLLLEADSDFPHEFSLDRLTDGYGEKELKELVNGRSALHEMIRLGKLQELKTFITQNVKPSRKYLNIQGQSALYTSVIENQYDIYAFLKSIGVYFKDEQEESCLDSLKIEDRVELKNYLIEYFPKLPDSHILFLVSKSKSVRPYSDFRNTVSSIFKNLDEIPHISQILQVIQYVDYIEIIFDFDREDIFHMEPRHSSSTRGATDYKSGRLYVGFKMDTPEQESECLGTLAHELCHLAMQITFQNDCNPFEKTDLLEKSRFVNEIVLSVREVCINSDDVNDIITRVFTEYRDPDDWPAELIVRVPQILAQYGEDEGSDIINTHTPQMLSYFTHNILPKYEEFVHQNFLIKPRNMVRTLNQYLGHITELEKANISFEDISYDIEFFDTPERNILLINTSSTWLSSINVLQALKKTKEYAQPNSHLVIRLDDFEDFHEDIIDAFSSVANNLLMIECHDNVTDKMLSKMLKDVIRIFRLSKKKKIVLIVHNDYVAEVKKNINKARLLPKMLEHADKEFTLTDLSDESQKKLLERKVIFQGTDTILKNILHEETTNIVDSDTLVRLINNNKVIIGKSLGGLFEVEDYYVARSFNVYTNISEDILKDEGVSDLFFISGSNLESVKQYKNVQVCNADNREFEDRMFCSLCENYKNRNIHHLRLITSKLIWVKTKGSLSSLRKYRRIDSSGNYSESDLIEENLNYDLLIISDTAGMGKTTVLTKLALDIKRKYPFYWVFRIDLNNYNHELERELNKKEKSFNNIDLNLALNFLTDKILKVSTQFEKNIIKESFKKGGNVIMLFDGFDEISPLYKDITVNFIHALKNSKVKKIFVTCRPYVAEVLEETFSVFSIGIEQLSNTGKKDFLVKFWKKRFHLNKADGQDSDERKKLEHIAETLINKLSTSINDKQQSFTGIPLQLRMVGEIFPEGGDTEDSGNVFLYKDVITLPEILNLLDLYKRFVDKKYNIYKIEKMKPATAIAAADVEEGRQTFIKNHQKIAVYSLLPNEQHPILLTDEEIEHLEDFLNKIIEGKEKTGIIDGVIKVASKMMPHFIHLTFAEYFAASFLSLKLSRKNPTAEVRSLMLTNIFVLPKYEVVRHFLNQYMEKMQIADVLDDYGSTFSDLWTSNRRSISNIFEQSALHIAVMEDNENIVTFLLLSQNKQHDTLKKIINAEDKNGRSALHAAAENGNFKLVQLLVDNGADVNAKENDDKTVLYYAAKHNIQLMHYLVQHGADPSLVNTTQLYLHTKGSNQMETFKWLVENGSNVDISDMYGETVVYYAAIEGDLDIIKWLIRTGKVYTSANDGDERTLLHYSAGSVKWEIVKWFLENEIFDVDLRDKNGNTILHYAAYNGNKDIVQWLIRSKDLGGGGANINIVDNSGRNILHEAAHSGNLELMKWLVTVPGRGGGGVDINSRDHNGKTVLHEAAFFGQLHVLKWLVSTKESGGEGADVCAADKNGQTALDMAALLGNLEIVQFLMSVITDDHEVELLCKKILQKAASFGELKLVEWLIQNARSAIDYRDDSGKCMLHFAAKHNNIAVVKWLLESGACVDLIDEDGRTPLHEAAGTGVQDIEEWLTQRDIFITEVADELTGTKKITIELKPNQDHYVQYLKDMEFQVKGMEFGKFVFHVEALASLKLLLRRGANISTVDIHGRTPLYYATFLDKPGVVGCDVLKFLISPAEDSGRADINIVDDSGRTLVHKLAEDGEFHLMKWLLETKTDSKNFVSVADANGFAPLHYAALSFSPGTVHLLAKYGADIHTVNKYKRTALHEAAKFHDIYNFDTLKALVECMIHQRSRMLLNAVDVDGFTALHYTVVKGNIQAVKYLVQHGANINIKDNCGCTPVHLAAKYGQIKVVKYLIEKNALDLKDNNGKTALDLACTQGHIDIKTFLENSNFVTGNSEAESP